MVRKKKGIQRYKPDTSKRGPTSIFLPGMLRKVTLLAKLGATNKTFAEFFEKDISTIEYWIKNAPEFKKARKIVFEISQKQLALSGTSDN